MRSKALLMEQIERERTYLEAQKTGSEEYVASQNRLMSLLKQLSDIDDQAGRFIAETIKMANAFALPIIGLVWITASEKEITFTGALRDYTKCFLPAKWR